MRLMMSASLAETLRIRHRHRGYFGSARILMQPSLTVPLLMLMLCSRRPLNT